MTIIDAIRKTITETKNYNRSAWGRGVTAYALELLDNYEEGYGADTAPTEDDLLNGARNWHDYSWGGCSLIYDPDIAGRLCTPSELKRSRNGERRPNSVEQWLDVQARALYQAERRIHRAAVQLQKGWISWWTVDTADNNNDDRAAI